MYSDFVLLRWVSHGEIFKIYFFNIKVKKKLHIVCIVSYKCILTVISTC